MSSRYSIFIEILNCHSVYYTRNNIQIVISPYFNNKTHPFPFLANNSVVMD